jgi:hypothetical protein
MIALPISILALAAGVYLLIKVNREYLGGIFKFFAWLIIVLSLLSTAAVIRHGVHHFRMRHHHFQHCDMAGGGMNGGCSMDGMHSGCNMGSMHCCGMSGDSTCPMMSGCKMVGDSVVLDRAVCEKMMGKDACEKLCKDRGQCIMTKDECAKMCGGMTKGDGGMKSCCMGDGKPMGAACCKGDGRETKACCKK